MIGWFTTRAAAPALIMIAILALAKAVQLDERFPGIANAQSIKEPGVPVNDAVVVVDGREMIRL